jgi:hypothetical protein
MPRRKPNLETSATALRRKLRTGAPLTPEEAAAAQGLAQVGARTQQSLDSWVDRLRRRRLPAAGVTSPRLQDDPDEVWIQLEAVGVQKLKMSEDSLWGRTPREIDAHLEAYIDERDRTRETTPSRDPRRDPKPTDPASGSNGHATAAPACEWGRLFDELIDVAGEECGRKASKTAFLEYVGLKPTSRGLLLNVRKGKRRPALHLQAKLRAGAGPFIEFLRHRKAPAN